MAGEKLIPVVVWVVFVGGAFLATESGLVAFSAGFAAGAAGLFAYAVGRDVGRREAVSGQ